MPPTPLEISAVLESMMAPSETGGLKKKSPPVVTIFEALLASPSQKSVRVNEASSLGLTVTNVESVALHPNPSSTTTVN